eukprot:4530909-Prymnesium_polylepis.1
MPPVMAMPAQPAPSVGPMSQAALLQAQMQLQQVQSALAQQTSSAVGGSSAVPLAGRSVQKALPPGPAAIIENGRVLCCPYCTGKSICCGGSTRGMRY